MKRYFCIIFLSFSFCYTQAQTSQEKAKAYYQEAVKEFSNKDYKRTLDYCQEVVKELGSNNARIELLKIKSYYELNQIDAAKESIKSFLSLTSEKVLKQEAMSYIVKIEEKENLLQQQKMVALKKVEKERLEKERIREEERLKEEKLIAYKAKRDATLSGIWDGTHKRFSINLGEKDSEASYLFQEGENTLKGGAWQAKLISEDDNYKVFRGKHDQFNYTVEFIYNKKSKALDYDVVWFKRKKIEHRESGTLKRNYLERSYGDD